MTYSRVQTLAFVLMLSLSVVAAWAGDVAGLRLQVTRITHEAPDPRLLTPASQTRLEAQKIPLAVEEAVFKTWGKRCHPKIMNPQFMTLRVGTKLAHTATVTFEYPTDTDHPHRLYIIFKGNDEKMTYTWQLDPKRGSVKIPADCLVDPPKSDPPKPPAK